jgi:predicted alpha/beta-hydrolase family hydrolase
MKLSTTARLLAAVLVVAALAGCAGHSSTPAADADSTAGPIAGEECGDLSSGGTQVRFADAHAAELTGLVFGKGSTGVVLSHMSDGDICGWLAYAQQLAHRGYRVIVYYFHGFGTSSGGANDSTLDGDVIAAAGYLRAHGTPTIALIGASMGATATVVAAAALQPPPAVVVSLSAPKYYRGLDALEAAGKLTAPVLYTAGLTDGDYADAAQALFDATPPSTNRTLLVATSSAHGTGLIGTPGSQVRDAMDKALQERAPAGG